MKPSDKYEHMRGSRNNMWAGDKIGYKPLHAWIRRNYPEPALCMDCKIKPPLDLANIADKPNPETYTRDIKNWLWLCRSCHMKQDGRIENLKHEEATHCHLGHPYSGYNLQISISGKKYCRACRKIHLRAWRQRKKLLKKASNVKETV